MHEQDINILLNELIQLNNYGNCVPYAISKTPSAGKVKGSLTTSETEACLSSKVRIEKEERIAVRDTFRKQQVEQVITTQQFLFAKARPTQCFQHSPSTNSPDYHDYNRVYIYA